MEQELNLDSNGTPNKRSILLTILCVLSFIYSGVAALFVVAVVFFVGDSILVDGAFIYVLIALAVIGLNLISVRYMWKLKLIGFYLYILTSIIFTCIQVYLTEEITWYTVLVPLFLMGLFYTQFKQLQ